MISTALLSIQFVLSCDNFRSAGRMYCKVVITLRVMPARLPITRSVMTTMPISIRFVHARDDLNRLARLSDGAGQPKKTEESEKGEWLSASGSIPCSRSRSATKCC